MKLQERLYRERRLSHLRYGDYLRDKNAIDGQAAAAELLDELIKRSMDEDLLVASAAIADGDKTLTERVEKLTLKQEKSKTQYESRREAAKERVETRKQWKEQDKAAKTPKPSSASAPAP